MNDPNTRPSTAPPRLATVVACDIAAPIIGGFVGAAITAHSYVAPTPFQVAMSIASAGLVGHAAGMLCHEALEVEWMGAPSSLMPEGERTLIAGAERRS